MAVGTINGKKVTTKEFKAKYNDSIITYTVAKNVFEGYQNTVIPSIIAEIERIEKEKGESFQNLITVINRANESYNPYISKLQKEIDVWNKATNNAKALAIMPGVTTMIEGMRSSRLASKIFEAAKDNSKDIEFSSYEGNLWFQITLKLITTIPTVSN